MSGNMSLAVLGGGISGLSTAFYLSKAGKYGISLYESGKTVGGWIKSFRTDTGVIFELGPRILKYEGKNSENTLDLIQEIGLKSSIVPVPKSSPVSRNKLIYVNNQFLCVPNSFMSLFKGNPPYIKPILSALWKDLQTPKKFVDDESVYDFVSRRFGHEFAEYITSAMVCGIFGGDSREISVKSMMPYMFELEQKYGSVCQGIIKESTKKKKRKDRMETRDWYSWSFKDGMQSLPRQMKNYLLEKSTTQFLEGKKCSKVTFQNGKAVLTINGQEETADHLFCSLPSRELANILGNQYSFLKTELSAIPFVSFGVVNLEYEGNLLQQKAFGFLVPPNQNLPILGVMFNSCIFPQDGKTVLSVLMGGRWFETHFGSNPDEKFLLQTAEDYVRKILKIDKIPVNSMVAILKNCLPQYIVGHSRRVDNIRKHIAEKKLPLTLVGHSYDGVGIHSAIISAKNNVEITLPQMKQGNSTFSS